MAPLAQGLERTSPELHHIAAMRLDMVTDEQRRVAFDATTLCTLAGVEIAPEDLQTQLSPACRLVQRPAPIIATTAAIPIALQFRCSGGAQHRPNRAKPWLNEADLRHVQINKKPLTPRRWRLLNVISACERTSLSMHDAGLEPLAVAMWADGTGEPALNAIRPAPSSQLICPKRQASAAHQFEFGCRPRSRQTYSASHDPLPGDKKHLPVGPSALLQKETVSGSEPTREMNLVDPLAKFLHIFVMSAISKSYFRIRH
jgi:hypothetical protein